MLVMYCGVPPLPRIRTTECASVTPRCPSFGVSSAPRTAFSGSFLRSLSISLRYHCQAASVALAEPFAASSRVPASTMIACSSALPASPARSRM